MPRGESVCKSDVYLIWSDRIIDNNRDGHFLEKIVAFRIGLQVMANIAFNEMQRIRKHFDDLQGLFQTYLPNVDTDLIYDLLTRLRENPGVSKLF